MVEKPEETGQGTAQSVIPLFHENLGETILSMKGQYDETSLAVLKSLLRVAKSRAKPEHRQYFCEVFDQVESDMVDHPEILETCQEVRDCYVAQDAADEANVAEQKSSGCGSGQ